MTNINKQKEKLSYFLFIFISKVKSCEIILRENKPKNLFIISSAINIRVLMNHLVSNTTTIVHKHTHARAQIYLSLKL